MRNAGLGVKRHFVTFIHLKGRFAMVIPIVSGAEIPRLIELTFNRFMLGFDRKPRILVSCHTQEYISE